VTCCSRASKDGFSTIELFRLKETDEK